MKLKKFKIKNKKAPLICTVCFKEFKKLSIINIYTSDSSRGYIGNGRPFVNNYRIRCCDRCFKRVVASLEKSL